MFETKPMLHGGPKPEKPASGTEDPAAKKERLEYHKQVMEVVLESAEKVLWQNPKLGMPDLVEKILEPVYALGAEPSPIQRKWVEQKVQQWIDDVGDEIEAVKYLLDRGYAWARIAAEDGDDEQRIAAEEESAMSALDSEEPWLLLETDPKVQGALLAWLPVKNKNPERYRFHAEKPPFLVIICLYPEDYQDISPYSEFNPEHSTAGIASRGSFLVQNMVKSLEAFNGSIAVMRGGAGVGAKIHEVQHLLYGKYIVDKKAEDVNAIDELAAYLKEGVYQFDEGAIFSHSREDASYLQEKKYDPEWQRVKLELQRLKYLGVSPSVLWSKAATSDDLVDFANRIALIKINDEDIFRVGLRLARDKDFFHWFLHMHNKIDKSVADDLLKEGHGGSMTNKVIGSIGKDFSDILEDYKKNRGTNSAFGSSHYEVLDTVLAEMEFCLEQGAVIFPEFAKTPMLLESGADGSSLGISKETLSSLKDCLKQDFSEADEFCYSFFSERDKGGIWIKEVATFVRELRKTIAFIRMSHEARNRLQHFLINDGNFTRLVSERLHIDNFDSLDYAEKLRLLGMLQAEAMQVRSELFDLLDQAGKMEDQLFPKNWGMELIGGKGQPLWDKNNEDIFSFFEKFKVKYAALERKFAETFPDVKK